MQAWSDLIDKYFIKKKNQSLFNGEKNKIRAVNISFSDILFLVSYIIFSDKEDSGEAFGSSNFVQI